MRQIAAPAIALLSCVLAAACAPTVPEWTDADHALVNSGPKDNPFVHTDGTKLVNADGEQVFLRGANLGGWLSWEGWMFGGGWSLDGESKLMAKLAELVGPVAAERFREDVREQFITEEDIAALADAGASSVRVGINHVLVEERDDHSPREAGYAILDRLLSWCEQHDVQVVLDLHAAPGGQSPHWMADPDEALLWDSEQKQDRTVAIWQEIARRYKDREVIAAWDLLNEPSPPDGETLLRFFQRLAAAVREIDPYHLILLEGPSAASDMTPFTEAVTWNQAYSVHQYEWFGDWREDELDRWEAVSDAHGVPLYVGEFGLSHPEDLKRSVDIYDRRGLAGFAVWSWKEAVDEDDMPVIIEPPQDWIDVAKYMNGGWGKPSKKDAQRGMAGFLDALHIDECRVQQDVLEMFERRVEPAR
jgi:endoglucanase